MKSWTRGDHVVWRSRPGGDVGYVAPLTVVVDTPEVTVLYQHAGSVCKRRSGIRGGPRGRGIVPGGWDGTHIDRQWEGPPVLRVYRWRNSWAVYRSWDVATNSAQGWYVNLESPWRRTVIGFDTHDLALDVTAADDLSSWAWKDEDELAWCVEVGTYSREQEDQIWEAGRAAVAALEARAFPFGEDWSQWRPDDDWSVPVVPPGWNDPSL